MSQGVMQSRVPGVQKIEENYEKEEEKTREQLKKFKAQRGVMTLQTSGHRNFSRSAISMNSHAETRNLQFLKDLEISKARLRTLTSFSPTDQELRQHVLAYRTALNGPKKR